VPDLCICCATIDLPCIRSDDGCVSCADELVPWERESASDLVVDVEYNTDLSLRHLVDDICLDKTTERRAEGLTETDDDTIGVDCDWNTVSENCWSELGGAIDDTVANVCIFCATLEVTCLHSDDGRVSCANGLLKREPEKSSTAVFDVEWNTEASLRNLVDEICFDNAIETPDDVASDRV